MLLNSIRCAGMMARMTDARRFRRLKRSSKGIPGGAFNCVASSKRSGRSLPTRPPAPIFWQPPRPESPGCPMRTRTNCLGPSWRCESTKATIHADIVRFEENRSSASDLVIREWLTLLLRRYEAWLVRLSPP